MRKLRRMAESTVVCVKHLHRGFHDGGNHLGRKASPASGKRFRLRQRALDHLRLFHHVAAFIAKGVRDRSEHPPEAGTPVSILGREISPAIKRFAIRREKRGERPSALPADRADRNLVPAVDVWTLIPVHLHRDESLVQNLRDLRILVGFAIHHVTPMAPHRANIEQNRFVVPLRRGEGVVVPLMPLHRLMHGRTEIGGGGAGKGIRSRGGHRSSLNGFERLQIGDRRIQMQDGTERHRFSIPLRPLVSSQSRNTNPPHRSTAPSQQIRRSYAPPESSPDRAAAAVPSC